MRSNSCLSRIGGSFFSFEERIPRYLIDKLELRSIFLSAAWGVLILILRLGGWLDFLFEFVRIETLTISLALSFFFDDMLKPPLFVLLELLNTILFVPSLFFFSSFFYLFEQEFLLPLFESLEALVSWIVGKVSLFFMSSRCCPTCIVLSFSSLKSSVFSSELIEFLFLSFFFKPLMAAGVTDFFFENYLLLLLFVSCRYLGLKLIFGISFLKKTFSFVN